MAGHRQRRATRQTSSHGEQAASLGWALDKLITPLLIGAVLAVFGIFAPPWIVDRLQAPTCEDPRDLRLATPDQVEGQSKPADNFPKKGIVAYGVANLIDGNTSTAWVEDRQGLGLGSQFTLRFQSPVDVRLVCVVDGYAESWDLYKRNSRARLLTVDTQQGTRAALLRDAGSPDRPAVYQRVNVAPGMTTYLTLTINGAYAAQRDTTATLAYSDTSISEVESGPHNDADSAAWSVTSALERVRH